MKLILKKIYKAVPFKKQFFSIIKSFIRLPEKVYRHLSFTGIFKVKVKESSFLMYHHGFQIENDIFWSGLTGGWEKESIKLWIELSKRSKIIFDLGANT
ncbi:MAG: methyltransferase, partial [Bacteroidota bacterium]|nr:methyltransferase [Bacteroidota bacterium]